MFKVKVLEGPELVYCEYFGTLQAAKEDFNSQLDYIASEKCYDPELQALKFIVVMSDASEKILESVNA